LRRPIPFINPGFTDEHVVWAVKMGRRSMPSSEFLPISLTKEILRALYMILGAMRILKDLR
jgi:hypothetical protein